MPRPYAALKAFLADPRRPEGTFQYHELQGLFTITGAPELVRPSEWIPAIFADGSAGYESLEEAQLVLGELMSLYNAVNAGVVDEQPKLPPDCRWRRDVLANLQEDAPVAQWSRGFLEGHRWLEESWDSVIPDELSEDFGLTLMALTFFASPTLAKAYLKEMKAESLEGLGRTMRRTHRYAMREYAWLGRTIQRVRAEQDAEEAQAERQPARREQPKMGRNEPCPCGSGRKFKKCCGATVH